VNFFHYRENLEGVVDLEDAGGEYEWEIILAF